MKRIFAVIRPDGLFLHLPDERKEFLFEAAPDTFVKYMWGKTANVIVQLGKIGKRELEGLIREAYDASLPPAKPKRPAKGKPKDGAASPPWPASGKRLYEDLSF